MKSEEVQKTNKLGNFALIFAFLLPPLGLILGIVSICVGIAIDDKILRKDGIKAVIMSIIVVAVVASLICVIVACGVAVPFIIMTM